MNGKIPNPLVGRIRDHGAALYLAKWAGEAFFLTAAMLIFFSLLTTAWLLPIAAVYVACGYYVRFKLSRIAAVMGVIFAILCFLPSYWLPGGRGGLVFGMLIWVSIRGAVAIFKLPRLSAVEGSPQDT
jgi:hypothetical protein